MDEQLVWIMIQEQIGNYQFKNLDLLKQAFTRRSYTAENGGENNEVLEFIGDKALDFAVVRILINHFGSLKNGDPIEKEENGTVQFLSSSIECSSEKNTPNTFISDLGEGQLTQLKSRMVSKNTLAQRIEELGFSEYLIMGKSDIVNNVRDEASVKEDLFEAIVGAVAVDSGFNQDKIQGVVETMLVPEDFLNEDSDTNYVRLIQEWEMQTNGCIPLYKYKEASYSSTWYLKEPNTVYQNYPLMYNYSRLKYHCYLRLLDDLPVFCGFGASRREARMEACRLGYNYLEENGMLWTIVDEIDNPTRDMSINQLEILSRRGYFSIPTYEFFEEHDENGNPVWKCECHIEEEEYFSIYTSSSKKDAKKGAAYDMLLYVLGMEDEDDD